VGASQNSCIIINCYSTGDVSNTNESVGGLIGHNNSSSTINNCYSTGAVTGISYVGGLVGRNEAVVSNSFWDTETSGQGTSDGGTGKTTAEMKYLFTYIAANWDFEEETANGSDDIWDIDESESVNNGFPYLTWQDGESQSLIPPAGSGTSGDPYQITCLMDLYWISANNFSWNSEFIQTNDIDASDTQNWYEGGGYISIGNNSSKFRGSYDGQDFTLDGLLINRPSSNYIGLFGYTHRCLIENLGITNVDLTSQNYLGGLAGYARGSTIKNCFVSGVVSGEEYVGGLVGQNYSSNITNCYSSGNVNAIRYLGGLIGFNYDNSSIYDSYSSSNIDINNPNALNEFVGGLVGKNWSSHINRCYSSGNVEVYDVWSGDNAFGGLVGSRWACG